MVAEHSYPLSLVKGKRPRQLSFSHLLVKQLNCIVYPSSLSNLGRDKLFSFLSILNLLMAHSVPHFFQQQTINIISTINIIPHESIISRGPLG